MHGQQNIKKYGDVKRALVVTHLILLIQFHRIRGHYVQLNATERNPGIQV